MKHLDVFDGTSLASVYFAYQNVEIENAIAMFLMARFFGRDFP